MKKIRLGNTNIHVTPVGLGVLTIGNSQLNLPLKEGANVVRYAYERGINFFDTAEYYETYHYIREAFKDLDLSDSNDKRPVIASKSLALSYDDMEKAIGDCLEEIGLESIDIFLLHEVRQDPDWEMRRGAWQCLRDYQDRGIIKAIGVSTHHIDVVQRMIEVPECDVVFPLINYAGLGIRKGSEPGTADEMAAAIKACMDKGKGVFAMKAFGGGNLTGTYMKALNYVRDLGVHSIMVGMGKTEEIDNLISYARGELTASFQPDVKAKRIHIDQGDCEGCMTCIDRCTSQAIFVNSRGLMQVDHSKCITCGYCAPVCPVRAIIMW